MYGHKPGDRRCPKNYNKKEENKKKDEYKNKKFDGICYHCGQRGHMSKDCRAQKYRSNKKFEKTEKAIDEDELVLCYLTKKIMKRKKFGSKKM